MKFYYPLIFLLTCYLLVGCKEKSNEVIITGYLENVEDGTVINLNKSEGRMFVTLQTDTVVNGSFRFALTDTVGQPGRMAILARGNGFPPTWLDVWVAPGANIQITGKDKLLRTWDVKSNVPEQIELNKYRSRTYEYDRISQTVMREAYSYFDLMKKFPEKEKEFRLKIDSLYAISDSMNNLIQESDIGLIKENKTYTPVWIGKLNHYAMNLRYSNMPDSDIRTLKNLYESMNDHLKNSETGQEIYISLYPPEIVNNGDDFADTDMWDLEGQLCRLADYKGKYILLDFWSSGCGPCLKAMPEMKEISEQYKDQLIVVSISSDSKDVWTKASEDKNITWVNLNDFKGENGIKLRYGVKGIPHYVMISPEGKVVTSWMGYGEGLLKTKMKELIN